MGLGIPRPKTVLNLCNSTANRRRLLIDGEFEQYADGLGAGSQVMLMPVSVDGLDHLLRHVDDQPLGVILCHDPYIARCVHLVKCVLRIFYPPRRRRSAYLVMAL
jgi:hypothetical protein